MQWTYWDISLQDLTSLFDKYRISDCMELSSPYIRSKSACETFLKTLERCLSQSDLDENVGEWVNGDSAPPRMKERLETFLSQKQEEGVNEIVNTEVNSLEFVPSTEGSKEESGKLNGNATESMNAECIRGEF